MSNNFKVRVLDYERFIGDWLGEIGSIHCVVKGTFRDNEGYEWCSKNEDGKFYDVRDLNELFEKKNDSTIYWAIFELVEEPEYNPDDVKLFINDEEVKGVPASELEYSNDPVNHPQHYTQGTIEVIDYIEDKKLGYHLGNAIKYVSRCEHKGNKIQDLEKAIWYIEREIYRSLMEEKE